MECASGPVLIVRALFIVGAEGDLIDEPNVNSRAPRSYPPLRQHMITSRSTLRPSVDEKKATGLDLVQNRIRCSRPHALPSPTASMQRSGPRPPSHLHVLLVENLVAADDEGSPLIGRSIANRDLSTRCRSRSWGGCRRSRRRSSSPRILLEPIRTVSTPAAAPPRIRSCRARSRGALIGPTPLGLPRFPQSFRQILDFGEGRVVVLA